MKVCKNCGEINTNDSAFCCNCGASNFAYKEEVACPTCGTYNDKSFAFCINCGASLVSNAEQPREDFSQMPPSPVDLQNEPLDAFARSNLPSAETAKCPFCGAVVPLTAIYCNVCGQNVSSLHDHRVVSRKVCPNCGTSNSPDRSLCAYCFHPLAEGSKTEMQLIHQQTDLGEFSVVQAYLEDATGKKLVCPVCGTLNGTEEIVCMNCGVRLDAESEKKYCANCGAENAFDATSCQECGWSFDGVSPSVLQKWQCDACGNVNNFENLYCTNCGAKKSR